MMEPNPWVAWSVPINVMKVRSIMNADLRMLPVGESMASKPAISPYVLEIPLDQLLPDPHQPRRTFDPEEIDELGRSIVDQGLQQFPTVNPAFRTEGKDYFYIKAGERRLHAHRAAGFRSMRCVVDPCFYDGKFNVGRRLAQAAKNSSRVPHRHSEIVAIVLDVVREETELNQGNSYGIIGKALKRVAHAFGKSEEWAKNYYTLTTLHPELHALLDRDDDERLNFQIACALARARKEDQLGILAEARVIRARSGHQAMHQFVVRTVRGTRLERGERIRGRAPSEQRDRLTNLVDGLLRGTTALGEGKTTRGLKLFIDTMLEGMAIKEAERLLHALREGKETLGLIEESLKKRCLRQP